MFVLFSCVLEKEETPVDEDLITSLDDTFVHFGDSNEFITGIDSLLVEEICFYPTYCTFVYDSMGYSGNYRIDHEDIWIEGNDEMDSLHLLIVNEDELKGDGIVAGRFLKKGSPAYFKAMQEVIELNNRDSIVEHEQSIDKENLKNTPNTIQPTSNSSSTPGANTPKPTSTTSISTNEDPRLSSAKKAVITFGKNLSGNTYRVRMSEPKTHDIYTVEKNASIYLMLTVDAKGNVVKSVNNASKTTTQDPKLINDIIDLSKQVKYNKEPGVNLVKIPLTIYVKTEQ